MWAALGAGFVLWIWVWGTRAAELPATEYQVRAAVLFNVAKYVEWPTNVLAATNTPLLLGVLGENRLAEALEKTVSGRSIGTHPLEVRRLTRESSLTECSLLYIGSSEAAFQAELMAKLKAAPVLTVGETDGFLEQGGVIRMLMKDNKVRFQVNLQAARQRRLDISARLLRLADRVVGKH